MPHIKLLSWNIDGLSEECLEMRTMAVIEIITTRNPDIVFLQEVIPFTDELLEENLDEAYRFFPRGSDYGGYYNLILVHRKFKPDRRSVFWVPFPGSKMDRHFLHVTILTDTGRLSFITTHLESLGPNSAERLRQFRTIVDWIRNSPEETYIWGGDLNIREPEIQKLANLPYGKDSWIDAGAPPKDKWTWDTKVNHNLRLPYKVTSRFDRVFCTNPERWPCTKFELIGKEKLACGLYPSDHWGIWSEYTN